MAPAVSSVAVDPLHPISGRALDPAQCVPPTALFLGVAGLAVAFVLRVREKKAAIRERPDVDASASQDSATESDPRHHQRVLAKARQATHISSAVTYYKAGTCAPVAAACHALQQCCAAGCSHPARRPCAGAGEYTKCNLELAKALAENSVCRAPAVLAHTPEEMANLYRLHIRYTEQPPSFATLLQLQEMLGISQEEAERIELELLRSPGTFAI